MKTFNSDGFTLGDSTDGNDNPQTYAAWAWNAGTTNFFNDVSETSIGTIDSTYRANPTAGFSIVSYTGNRTPSTQVAHGLNAKADFILFKNRTQTDNWGVYHKELGPEKYMYLNTDSVVGDDAGFFSDTDGNSNCFIVGDEDTVNGTSETMIAYCWSEVPGFSKFSNYIGSATAAAGGSEGPFIYCGFTPRWLLLKQAEASYNGSWVIYDTARTPTNSGENWIYANTSAAESPAASYAVTVTSTGFKVRSTSAENNGTGRNYIFAAFAESPLKYANAR